MNNEGRPPRAGVRLWRSGNPIRPISRLEFFQPWGLGRTIDAIACSSRSTKSKQTRIRGRSVGPCSLLVSVNLIGVVHAEGSEHLRQTSEPSTLNSRPATTYRTIIVFFIIPLLFGRRYATARRPIYYFKIQSSRRTSAISTMSQSRIFHFLQRSLPPTFGSCMITGGRLA